jgi:hypothetical protein
VSKDEDPNLQKLKVDLDLLLRDAEWRVTRQMAVELQQIEWTIAASCKAHALEPRPASPPAWAQACLRFLAHSKFKEGAINDIEELFERDCEKVGYARARTNYVAAVLGMLARVAVKAVIAAVRFVVARRWI